MNIEALYKIFQQHPSIQTDTRKLQKGDLFFALKGPSFNGNQFAKQALDKGAAYVIADEPVSFSDERIIQVSNVLNTLQQLAKYHRNQFNIPFIAITGSNGKTTTKELIHEVLSAKYKTYTTRGNLNNHIGVPLTILQVKKDAQIAVIEMGANHLKEIASYCEYTLPTHGLISNIGKAHLEGFGSLENVKKGKGELFDHLKKHNGIAFVNKDDEAVLDLSEGIKERIFYGKIIAGEEVDILKDDPFIEVAIDIDLTISTQLVGSYNLPNVLAAVALGKYFGIENELIKKSIENYSPSNSRSQLIKQGSNTIILDAYNANPGSMKAAIENFAKMQASNKILLLGDMKELGEESISEHTAIVSLIDQYNWAQVVLTGENFGAVKSKYVHLNTSEEAAQWLKTLSPQNTHILIKGSRGLQMEKVLSDEL